MSWIAVILQHSSIITFVFGTSFAHYFDVFWLKPLSSEYWVAATRIHHPMYIIHV